MNAGVLWAQFTTSIRSCCLRAAGREDEVIYL